MNIRRVQIRTEAGLILLRLDLGRMELPFAHTFELDPATALVLAGQLESAVHTAFPEGMPPSQTKNPNHP